MSNRPLESREWQSRDVVIPTYLNKGSGNAIGVPHGGFGFQIELAKALHVTQNGAHGTIDPHHHPRLEYSSPRVNIPENAQWKDPSSIISFHARGHRAAMDNLDLLNSGVKFLPTIAVTTSLFRRPEIIQAIASKKLTPDDKVLKKDGAVEVTDINIDPVWRLSEVAKRIGLEIEELRLQLATITGREELLSRYDIDLFLPPIDGPNVHVFGDIEKLQDESTHVVSRSHDYCRDGDNHAARCTCAASKAYAIEQCISAAQEGGVGIMVFNPEEGRNLGSVVKHLVYNVRETHPQGDSADRYFGATRDVAGGEDARMHWTKPDPYNWLLPHRRIDEWISESPHKREALEHHGIQIRKSIELPLDRISPEALVEITAKRGNGYNGESKPENTSSEPTENESPFP